MCCCCPPAISALFCLWFQSGCSKGTVAGALTFFPPEPPLYQFERRTADGRVLEQDEDAEEEEENTNNNNNNRKKEGPIEIDETRGEIEEKMQSPIAQLTDQATARRKRSQTRNERDVKDATANVHYRLLLDPRLQVPPHDTNSIQAVKIPSPRGVHVAAVIYRVPPEHQATAKTILVSHGNATDIGAMFSIQVVIAHALDANVVVYDYSGFGESGGVPDEAATYRDIDAVFEYVVENICDGDGKRVVLYGQSVGSGPCCYLSARDEVGGMILHSPFLSGMRVLTPSRALACLDIYPNIDRIGKVKCPVMVIHGCLDQEVDCSHGQELHAAVPDKFKQDPWWVPDRGHNDITDGAGRLAEYIRRLRGFLHALP